MTSDDHEMTETPASFATLGDILQTAISLKWVSAGIVFLSVIAGLLVALFAPLGQRAQVTLYPLSDFEVLDYQTSYFVKFMKLDPAILNVLFVETIREGKVLRESLLENKVLVRKPEESDAEFNLILEREMAKMTLTGPTPESQRLGSKNWTLVQDARNAEIGYKVLSDVLAKATLIAKTRLTERYNKSLSEHERAINFVIDENQRKRRNMLADYERMTTSKLAQLDEQVALLKSTGAKQGQVLSSPSPGENRDGISIIDTSKMVFLPGYEQVEKQASLIRSRADKESFVTGLLEVDQEIRRLQQDRSAEQGRLAFSESPLTRDDFKAITHDLTRASFRKIVSPAVIVLGALMLGLFAAVAIILIQTVRRALLKKA